jgi:hypothetical protein
MVAYQTQALERVYQGYADKAQGRILIVSGEGEVVFDSSEPSGGGERGLLPDMHMLQSGVESAVIDGKPYYLQTIMNQNRKYIGVNLAVLRCTD